MYKGPFKHNIICPICKRSIPPAYQEKHHLIPASIAKRKKYKKIDNRDETVELCCDCGNAIHEFMSNKELADTYNTIEKILCHPKVENWVKWISKRFISFGVCCSVKKRR